MAGIELRTSRPTNWVQCRQRGGAVTKHSLVMLDLAGADALTSDFSGAGGKGDAGTQAGASSPLATVLEATENLTHGRVGVVVDRDVKDDALGLYELGELGGGLTGPIITQAFVLVDAASIAGAALQVSASSGVAIFAAGVAGGTFAELLEDCTSDDGQGPTAAINVRWVILHTAGLASSLAAGSGDVTKVGTPANNQVGVWTGDGTIEGTADLTYNGATLAVTGDITVSGTVDGRDIAADGAVVDTVVAIEDDAWDIATEYAERSLVKRGTTWYRLPYVDGASPSTGDDPASGAPWEVFAITSGGGYPETMAATHEYIAGRFYPLIGAGTNPALTTQALSANRVDLHLVTFDRAVTFDQLGAWVTTGAAGNCKVLVYDADADGWPDALIFESADLDTTNTNTYANDTVGLPAFAAGTRYWIGLTSDAAATVRGVAATGSRSLGMAASSDTSIGYAIRRTGITFATPPDPWVFVASEISFANSPIVIGRSA